MINRRSETKNDQLFTSRASGLLGVVTFTAVLGLSFLMADIVGTARAQTHDDSHSSGTHTDGHEEGEHEDGTEAGGPRGPGGDGHGEGGHEDGSSGEGGKGPQAGGSGGAGRGKDEGDIPVWAREGIPEVELGRLNVARSPGRVIDRAFSEALASFTPEVAEFYRLDLDEMTEALAERWDTIRLIDSPLQNLALMRDALDGSSILSTVGITTDNDTLLAAFLGTASDKSLPVSADTVTAVAAILGQPVTASKAAEIAEMAEMIRLAIVEGHG